MNSSHQFARNRSKSLMISFALLALAVVLAQPRQAMAQWATSGNNIYNTNSGNVGVGTNAPGASLDVNGPDAAPSSTGGANGDLLVGSTATNLVLSMGVNSSGSPIYSWLQSRNRAYVSYYNLVLNPLGGNVGIGTSAPGYKLDVSGDINASGTIRGGNVIARYQDVAEWVPATHALPAGTVVVLDPTASNRVHASSASYDTSVAGVISAQPGVTLGEGSPDKVLVATTGRVKVKVDATRAPIRVGDLLVTSDKEGVAMRSIPLKVNGVEMHRPGTLIGKALEPLAGGTGEILVLLSLQ